MLQPSLRDRALVQVALTCRDLERARTFYRDTLGLQLEFEAGTMLFFRLGKMRLLIGRSERPDDPIGGTVLYFDAPDLASLATTLEARGITFLGPAQTVQRTATHELKLRAFKDPDGNALALLGEVPLP